MKRRGADAAGYLGLILLVTAGLVRLLFERTGTIALVLAAAGVVLFLVYFFVSGAAVEGFLGRRSTRAGGGVLGGSLFVVGIVVLVNILAAQFPARKDLTADRLYTLAPETVQAFRGAPEPPTVWVFYPENDPVRVQLRSLLEAAAYEVPGLTVHYVDPARDPQDALAFGLTEFATVVEVGERNGMFTGASEEDLLGSLLATYAEDAPGIAFLHGHGEASPTDRSERGLREAVDTLDRRGFRLRGVELARGESLEDFDLLLVVAPRTGPTAAEADSITRFLERGGCLLLAAEPDQATAWNPLVAPYGLQMGGEYLADEDQRDPQVIQPREYSSHPAVKPLTDRNIQTVFPGVGEVRLIDPSRPARQAALFRTGLRTRAAADAGAAQRRHVVAGAAEWGIPDGRRGRMIVAGDADFATNTYFAVLGNGDFFLNGVQWLAERDGNITVRARKRTSRPVVLSRQQGRAFMVLFTGLLPLAVLVAGSAVWWRRR